MSHHINDKGFFQSDKHPELFENKIALDFRDKYARPVLKEYAETCKDEELAEDIMLGLYNTRDMTKEPD